ncbi:MULTISPECIES: hypothetical protein [unclassified Mesorhizobium]|uniref:hypothetical protein n=1 Tax=unclassified Mesorhizobium TaxID=325217 RepID=UPI0033372273
MEDQGKRLFIPGQRKKMTGGHATDGTSGAQIVHLALAEREGNSQLTFSKFGRQFQSLGITPSEGVQALVARLTRSSDTDHRPTSAPKLLPSQSQSDVGAFKASSYFGQAGPEPAFSHIPWTWVQSCCIEAI